MSDSALCVYPPLPRSPIILKEKPSKGTLLGIPVAMIGKRVL